MTSANLTKSEISDLESLITRKIECHINVEKASWDLKQAAINLANELTRLQFRRDPPQAAKS